MTVVRYHSFVDGQLLMENTELPKAFPKSASAHTFRNQLNLHIFRCTPKRVFRWYTVVSAE
ncbi:hypothetical protein T05_7619 [Trichinella murrelli]|uniref:Uncharacterized protein n=1 Tax=Trichinella murrelli TaxID=144512 RepID=A0A0V0STL1_9BILA|nr:hypothetical protein T05_7619 [Trichinella murrelli]